MLNNKALAYNNTIYPYFRNGEINKKMKSKANLWQISEKLRFNEKLQTDKDLERNLDLMRYNQSAYINKSYNYN